jgi:hypothetical protein
MRKIAFKKVRNAIIKMTAEALAMFRDLSTHGEIRVAVGRRGPRFAQTRAEIRTEMHRRTDAMALGAPAPTLNGLQQFEDRRRAL